MSFQNLWIHHCNLLHVTNFTIYFLRPVLNNATVKNKRYLNNYHIALEVSKVLLVEMKNEERSCKIRNEKRKRSSRQIKLINAEMPDLLTHATEYNITLIWIKTTFFKTFGFQYFRLGITCILVTDFS